MQMTSLDRRFFARLGASRLTGSLCGATAGLGTAATNGTGLRRRPDGRPLLRLVVLWATNTRLTNRHLWPFIEEARANGATVVVIDPIRTITADSADWFIQPLPGTDVALILAIMHVLVRDGLVDQDYVYAHAPGYEELGSTCRTGRRQVAGISGLEEEEIERLARAYGTTRPAIIRTLIGAEHHEHGAMFFRSLACLPVLTGAWRDRGGGLARAVGSWSATSTSTTRSSRRPPAGGRAPWCQHEPPGTGADGLEPPVMALVAGTATRWYRCRTPTLTRQGLEREDLFASSASSS